MNIAILEVRKGRRDPRNSINVSQRNELELAKELGAEMLINVGDLDFDKKYDVIICGFGSTSVEYKRTTEFLKRNALARVFQLIGEYTYTDYAPLRYSGLPYQAIRNFTGPFHRERCIADHIINLNALLYRPPNKVSEKSHDAIYWGRWRDDRAEYFREYLQHPVYLSTSKKNFKKYINQGCHPRIINPLNWRRGSETLNLFKYSIYIEDKWIHKNYHHLANRFYEAVWCNMVQFFDISCTNTIHRAGLKVPDFYITRGHSEMARRMDEIERDDNFFQHLGNQAHFRKHAAAERMEALQQIKELILTK